MRILHLVNKSGGGGAERELRNLLVNFRSDQMEFGLYCWNEGEFHEDIVNSGVKVFVRPSSKRKPFSAVGDLTKVIREWKPDILQSWNPQFDVIGAAAGMLTRVPVVATEQNNEAVYRSGAYKGSWFTRARPLALKLGCRACYANSQEGAGFVRRLTNPNFRVEVIANGLELDEIALAKPADLPGVTDSAGAVKLVTASRLVPIKRVDLLLEAVASLRTKGVNVRLYVCGAGASDSSLRAKAEKLGLQNVAYFLGRRSDVISVYKACDIFCSASESEGMPNSVMEAMAAGLPLILSEIPAHVELAAGNPVAVFPKDRSVAAFADAIEDLVVDEAKRRRIAKSAFDQAQTYTIERMCKHFESFYSEFKKA